MTLREVYDLTKGDPLECLLAVSGVARSAYHGKGTTFDEDCGTALRILKRADGDVGKAVEDFIKLIGPVADVDIPDKLLSKWLEESDVDEKGTPRRPS